MAEYYALVSKGARAPDITYAVKTTDDGIVTVTPSGNIRSLTFELVFPDLVCRDGFMRSRRTRRDAERNRGVLSIITPYDLLSPESTTEQGKVARLAADNIAHELGVSVPVLYASRKRAWLAVIEWYQGHR